jgi:hypothetical protein
MSTDKRYNEFVEQQIEDLRNKLKTSLTFGCACCQKQKAKGKAAGVHAYATKNPILQKAMIDPKTKMPKVATYVICLECIDNYPEDVIHTKVTAYLGSNGFFESV